MNMLGFSMIMLVYRNVYIQRSSTFCMLFTFDLDNFMNSPTCISQRADTPAMGWKMSGHASSNPKSWKVQRDASKGFSLGVPTHVFAPPPQYKYKYKQKKL